MRLTEAQQLGIKGLYEQTSLTLQQIADHLDLKLTSTWKFVKQNYSPQFRKDRKVRNYVASKQGALNPMHGKSGEQHPGFVGRVSDGKGYVMVLKPDWYTGRKGCKHVFEHHIVVCKELHLTEIPKDYCVHHRDGNRTNNHPTNLEFMTISEHTSLHQAMRLEGESLRAHPS